MNSETNRDVELVMQMISATELSTVEGGLVVLDFPAPFGDRMTEGCGTMILIDRMFGGMFSTRR
jgi:hypothetical protein